MNNGIPYKEVIKYLPNRDGIKIPPYEIPFKDGIKYLPPKPISNLKPISITNKFKKFCQLYSILFCAAQAYLLLFPMFLLAYSSGTYECLMKINVYGEATIEIIIWFVSFPLIMYGLYLNMKCALVK